jgi:exodeoxyribonuclease-3
MKTLYKKRKGKAPTVLVGDLNVAPGEFDVWSHKQLLECRRTRRARPIG